MAQSLHTFKTFQNQNIDIVVTINIIQKSLQLSRHSYPERLQERLGLSVLLQGMSANFSPSWLWDSNQQHLGYWPNALNH
jgi:hypothetical protein